MKILFLFWLLFIAIASPAQETRFTHYPVLANLLLTESGKESVDASRLHKGQTVQLAFAILNPSLGETVKSGSCGLQVDLGGQMQLTQQALAALPLTAFFRWSTTTDEKGNILLQGKLINDLPPDFAAVATLALHCAQTGTSILRLQWLDAQGQKQGTLSAVEFTIRRRPKQ